MAKGKDFTKSLGSKHLKTLIPTEEPASLTKDNSAEKVKPITTEQEITKKVGRPKSTAPASTVTTFRIENDNLLAIKAIAFWDRKKIQDVFNEALQAYVDGMPASTIKKAMEEYGKRHGLD